MSDNVIDLLTPSNPEIDNLFGPQPHSSWHGVVIEGKNIPKMQIREWCNKIEVLFDERWCYIFDNKEIAWTACSLAANALAVGQGYPWLGADTKDMPFAPTIMRIGP